MLAWNVTSSASGGAMTHRWSSLFSDPLQALHSDRQTFFEQIGDLVTKCPFGVGLGREGAVAGHLGTNDSNLGFHPFSEAYFGFLIIETGIFGAVMIAYFVFAYLIRALQAVKRLPMADDRLFASALAAILLVLTANCFLSPILSQPPGSVIFWLCCGIVGRMYAVERGRAAQSPAIPTSVAP